MDYIKTILAVGAGKSLATASLIIGKVKSAEMINFVFDKSKCEQANKYQ